MKKGIIISLLLSLIFVQSVYCYKLTLINDSDFGQIVGVNRKETELNPREQVMIEGQGCITNLTRVVYSRALHGQGSVKNINQVTNIDGVPRDKLKDKLCGDYTVEVSKLAY